MLRDQSIIGQTFTNKSGDKFTVIDGENAANLTIQFEDGAIRKNITHDQIKHGHIPHPSKTRENRLKNLIGQTFINNSNEKFTIIGGTNLQHITVQFENGLIKENIAYGNIKAGGVGCKPKISYKNHINQTFTNNSGDKFTVIDGKDSHHLTIRFEDGSIRENVSYSAIKNGWASHPLKQRESYKDHIGEIHTNNLNKKFTIIGGTDISHLTIRFEDGAIRKNIEYRSIKKGTTAHPSQIKVKKSIKNYIGKTYINNSGEKFTIIDGSNTKNMTIQFEDGTIRKNVVYSAIKNGQISHPSKILCKSKDRIGQTFTNKSNLKITIIDGLNTKNMTIQFEDGMIRKNVGFNDIKKGIISHPQLIRSSEQFHSIILHKKYKIHKHKCCYFYDCTCEICGKDMLLTPYQLMQHHLKCNKNNKEE